MVQEHSYPYFHGKIRYIHWYGSDRASCFMVLPSPHIQEPQCVTATDLKVKCLWHTSLYESQKNVL